MLVLFVKGLLLGILLTFPTGPVGFYCLSKIISRHYKAAWSAIIGSIAGDLVYCFIAIFSLYSVSGFIDRIEVYLLTIAGLFLVSIGTHSIIATNSDSITPTTTLQKAHFGNFFTSFIATVTNPIQLATLPLLFVGLNIFVNPRSIGVVILLSAIIAGSILCWFGWQTFFQKIDNKIPPHLAQTIDRIGMYLIIILGLILLLKGALGVEAMVHSI